MKVRPRVVAVASLALLAVPARAGGESPGRTVVSATSSASVDLTLRNVAAGEALRDLRLESAGGRPVAAFIQELPHGRLVAVAVTLGRPEPPQVVAGSDTLPDGRYRVTIVTTSPASLVIPSRTSGTALHRASRKVSAVRQDWTSSDGMPVHRSTRVLPLRARGLYALVLATNQGPFVGGTHKLCLGKETPCTPADSMSLTRWHAQDPRSGGWITSTLTGTIAPDYDRKTGVAEFEAAVVGRVSDMRAVLVTVL